MNIFDEMIARADAAEKGGAAPLEACACGGALNEVSIREQIPFGLNGVVIEIDVPATVCAECGRARTDRRAEVARHAAVCRHQGLLEPERIKAIRKNQRMTRQEFSDAYGIPPASMERWENGKLLQNRSMDKLLRAIEDPLSLNPPRKAASPAEVLATPGAGVRVEGNVIWANFPALRDAPEKELADVEERDRRFNLRRFN